MRSPADTSVRRAAAARRWLSLAGLLLIAVAATVFTPGPARTGTEAAGRGTPIVSMVAAPDAPVARSMSRDRTCVEAIDVASPADPALPDPEADPTIVRGTAASVYPVRPEIALRSVASGALKRPPRSA